jgi:hypothetical protein
LIRTFPSLFALSSNEAKFCLASENVYTVIGQPPKLQFRPVAPI